MMRSLAGRRSTGRRRLVMVLIIVAAAAAVAWWGSRQQRQCIEQIDAAVRLLCRDVARGEPTGAPLTFATTFLQERIEESLRAGLTSSWSDLEPRLTVDVQVGDPHDTAAPGAVATHTAMIMVDAQPVLALRVDCSAQTNGRVIVLGYHVPTAR